MRRNFCDKTIYVVDLSRGYSLIDCQCRGGSNWVKYVQNKHENRTTKWSNIYIIFSIYSENIFD